MGHTYAMSEDDIAILVGRLTLENSGAKKEMAAISAMLRKMHEACASAVELMFYLGHEVHHNKGHILPSGKTALSEHMAAHIDEIAEHLPDKENFVGLVRRHSELKELIRLNENSIRDMTR